MYAYVYIYMGNGLAMEQVTILRYTKYPWVRNADFPLYMVMSLATWPPCGDAVPQSLEVEDCWCCKPIHPFYLSMHEHVGVPDTSWTSRIQRCNSKFLTDSSPWNQRREILGWSSACRSIYLSIYPSIYLSIYLLFSTIYFFHIYIYVCVYIII